MLKTVSFFKVKKWLFFIEVGHLSRKTIIENYQFLQNDIYISYLDLIHTSLNKVFKDIVVNRTWPFLHRGSFEITLTVPLISLH